MVIGIDDAALAALATVVAGGVQGGMSASGSKKTAKETKRQTLADMYNKALQRQMDQYKFAQENSGNNTARRAAALQETSNQFGRALGR